MKLMTKEIEKRLEQKYPLYSQENVKALDKVVVCKYFNPCGSGTWLVTEGERQEDGDWLFFGYVIGLGEDEWGYFTLSQLEAVVGPLGLGIEREIYYKPCSMTVREFI